MLNWLGSLYPEWFGSSSADREEDLSAGDESASRVEARIHGAGAEGEDASTRWDEILDGEGISKQQVWVELGLPPDEFLVELVRRSGGRMWQADIVATTDWSKSTVSRHLGDLESSDAVERVQIGRRKLVGLPGEMPDGVSGSRTRSEPPRERPSEASELA